MRKIEREMRSAIAQRRNWHKDNTQVRVDDKGRISVFLHGNLLAESSEGVPYRLESCGATIRRWPTNTTRSRYSAMGFTARIRQGKLFVAPSYVNV